jgi:uncharacterized protein YceK
MLPAHRYLWVPKVTLALARGRAKVAWMHSTLRALAIRGAWLAVVLVLAGCSAISSITGGGSSAPGASGAGGSAKPGASHGWPAAFQDSFCAGLASLDSATPDLNKLVDAASTSDFVGVAKFAKAALTKVKAADAALKIAPAWGPPTEAIAAYRSALKTYITGLTDIEKGARTKNATLLLRSLPVLSAGVRQLAPAQTAFAALRLGTGFSC